MSENFRLMYTSHNTDASCVHKFLLTTQEGPNDAIDEHWFDVQETPYELIVDGVDVLGFIPEWLAPYLVHYKGEQS